ncbi:hypothetical protein B0H15DRAFT_386319 [Mycena belliarum]|uniref:WDR59/RTC1-like RING zinc finger domain-containing protein n=1 Tax=Mycena belliarum TaxID=1033014 RepID=A0AAD6U4J8_9AGAR|nr:hypothetical protein B0H15DRAFT_386319 [Mycena belliae]
MPRRTGAPADEQSPSSPRPRVSSTAGIVNFAPPPLNLGARRSSWIGGPNPVAMSLPSSGSMAAMNVKSTGKRMYYPMSMPEEEASGSATGSGSQSSSSSESSRPAEMGGDSSEDANNFRTGMQIDMKGLVGDAVGNMSISPTSRDIVLAARRGLFIIDLEAPLSVPRFLPQGGTWDVADVQWNPHPSRAEYIVSTSSEKLLIWNLNLPFPSSGAGSDAQHPSSIQHILHAHYRAITDINWHPAPAERDLVVSTGVDAWLWAWDLRAARGGRAVFGLSAFNAGGTQVKWNRQDPHVLASSHAGEVLIWDRRKGSLPTTRLRAHRSKIYGIDWSPVSRNALVTCALDGTIKVWDVGAAASWNGTTGNDGGLYGATPAPDAWNCADCAAPAAYPSYPSDDRRLAAPTQTIRTPHPVWRARHLPFGRGVLGLPQRGGTGLGMWAVRDPGNQARDGDGDEPVEMFEGHTDVVKEFVWRRGGPEGTSFQLITWSKDRTLRFWPVDAETMQKVGYVRPELLPTSPPSSPAPPTFSFRSPPPPEGGAAQSLTSPPMRALSAPIGARAILAGVRAGAPAARKPPPGPVRMSRGTAGGRRVGMDALTWLSNVKGVAGGTGGERSSSGGRGAGSSGGVSDYERSESLVRRRSDSRGRALEEGPGQSLQDELTSVISKLVSAKIKLEKHDLTKKRTCTLGLHGPWGESSSVFIRITFTFPKDYPLGHHPRGTPTVELERNPLISLKNRAFILRRLRALRERQRPCLEACLRFLSEGEKSGAPHPMDSESSDDDDGGGGHKTVTLLRSHKNLAEPRTSQGTFGPNGELVCFFRAPPRIVRHVLRDLSISASPAKTVSDIPTTAHDSVDISGEHAPPRVFRSPALVADAVRRLSLAATDRIVKPLDPRRAQDGDHILRIMTNLLTFSHDTSHHRDSDASRLRGDDNFRRDGFAYPAPRRSMVFITNTTHISGADRKVAADYVFEAETLALLCQKNAAVAREHGRYDHERIFKILHALFPGFGESFTPPANVLVVKMVTRVHSELCKMKDIQMLAMFSTIVVQGCRKDPASSKSPESRGTLTPKFPPVDYFTISQTSSGANTGRMSPGSPTWPRLNASPPVTSSQPTLSTSNSSRGSWSSLFNAGSMRSFMSGVQDSIKDGLTTPSEPPVSAGSAIPVPKGDRFLRGPDSPLPRRRGYWRDSGLPSPSSISKSWNDPLTMPIAKHAVSFSSAGHRRSPFSRLNTPRNAIHEARVVVYEVPSERDRSEAFPAEKIAEFLNHVHIYADLLFSWQLFHKRLELLKSVSRYDAAPESAQHGIGLMRSCSKCGEIVEAGKTACRSCSRPSGALQCTVCRLPVRGLSRSCLRCFHVTHISCWKRLDVPICPSGCGCVCDSRGFAQGAPLVVLPASTPVTASRSRASSKGTT